MEQDSKDFDFENRDNIKKPNEAGGTDGFDARFGDRRLTKEERGEVGGAAVVKRKKTLKKELQQVQLEDFELLMVLGRGAFGKVFLGELNVNRQLYAIKSIRKDILI